MSTPASAGRAVRPPPELTDQADIAAARCALDRCTTDADFAAWARTYGSPAIEALRGLGGRDTYEHCLGDWGGLVMLRVSYDELMRQAGRNGATQQAIGKLLGCSAATVAKRRDDPWWQAFTLEAARRCMAERERAFQTTLLHFTGDPQ